MPVLTLQTKKHGLIASEKNRVSAQLRLREI